MGFYPKHLRRRCHLRNMKLIATAALSGCMFERVVRRVGIGRFNYNGDEMGRDVVRWGISYAEGKRGRDYDSKGEAAAVYMMWWLQKQNMWPRYPV